VVLAMDGLDARLLEKFMRAGELPHFERLVRSGTFSRLGTTWPPQSPVAWSTFITGLDPGGHGIFDMWVREPATYRIVDGMVRFSGARVALKAGGLQVPVLGSGVVRLRHGTPFWRHLSEAGIPASLYKVPADFPATGCGARTLSGLGTTDLRGEVSNSFSYYTDQPPAGSSTVLKSRVFTVIPTDGKVVARLYGPANPWSSAGEKLTCPFTAHISSDGEALLLEVCGQRVLLRRGEWSDWVPVEFPHPTGRVPGMVRFYAKQIRPHFQLYVSPVNVDPARPVLPIASPRRFSRSIARAIGRFYTQGWPTEFGARIAGVFDDDEYLAQAELVWRERARLFDYAWEHYDGGFLFFYFCLSDLNSHMFWRAQDPKNPMYSEQLARRHGDVILRTYRRLDGVLGRVLATMPAESALVVMSDHGFAPLRRRICVNRWLEKEGLLVLRRPRGADGEGEVAEARWSRTAAYQIGLNGLYLNRRGREREGILSSSEADELARRIQKKLPAFRDPATGQRPVRRVMRREEVYHGPHAERAPDLIIGYAAGYRGFDATGRVAREVITTVNDPWTGTHMSDPAVVPALLISNRPLRVPAPRLGDLGRSICALFGVRTRGMPGREVFGKS